MSIGKSGNVTLLSFKHLQNLTIANERHTQVARKWLGVEILNSYHHVEVINTLRYKSHAKRVIEWALIGCSTCGWLNACYNLLIEVIATSSTANTQIIRVKMAYKEITIACSIPTPINVHKVFAISYPHRLRLHNKLGGQRRVRSLSTATTQSCYNSRACA